MKLTLELDDLIEAKLIRFLECEGQDEAPVSAILRLLEESLDEELEAYPVVTNGEDLEEFASLGELL